MRKFINIMEENDFDIEDDIEDAPQPKYPFLNYLQKKYLDKHKAKQDKDTFRKSQKKRRGYEEELRDTGYRHVPKSEINYHPFQVWIVRGNE